MENNIIKLLDGRSITWLEKKSGVHRNSITSNIKGASPRLNNAYRIAKAFGVSVYEVWPDITQDEE